MEILSTENMYEADRYAINQGVSALFLMTRAGQHVAAVVEALGMGPVRILALAGPGNNGGDAYVAATYLKQRGYSVSLIAIGKPQDADGEAGIVAAEWVRAGGIITPFRKGMTLPPSDVIIDGIFGAGLSRDIDGDLADLVHDINKHPAKVISIDVPSGVNGNTGLVMGTAVDAERTVTFFRPKSGHYLYPGAGLVGQLTVHDIGIPERALNHIKPAIWLNAPQYWQAELQQIKPDGHKYHRGAVLIVRPEGAMPGATVLAANAAMRTGAGLVTLAEEKNETVNTNLYAAIMQVKTSDKTNWTDLIEARKINAIAIGPGSAPDKKTRECVKRLLQTGVPIILDAGALTAFENHSDDLITLTRGDRNSDNHNPHVILTPHEGEFNRLFGPLSARGKIEAARQAAKKACAIIVLKGADTVIAAPDGQAFINANAPAELATAGSGDVLSGMITACLARGLSPLFAASAAVYLHGLAASQLNGAIIADDLIKAIRKARLTIKD